MNEKDIKVVDAEAEKIVEGMEVFIPLVSYSLRDHPFCHLFYRAMGLHLSKESAIKECLEYSSGTKQAFILRFKMPVMGGEGER